MKQIIFTCLLTTSAFLLKAQPGTLDSSFGINGKVITENFEASINSILIQPDGKIVVGGVDYSINAYLVVRYNTDGSLDETFGQGGRAINDFGEPYFGKIIYAISLQPDGKIVAAGSFNPSGDDFKFAVMRFNSDGSVDSGFGEGGHTITSLASYDILRDMALLPDGRIVVTGDTQNGINDTRRSFIVCYTAQGVQDKEFGENGAVIITMPTVADITSIAVTKNAKIIIGGNYKYNSYNAVLLSYNNDGTPDTEFGNNGLAEMDFGNEILFSEINDLSLTSDNSILFSGYASVSGKYTSILVGKFKATGHTDSSFGTNGYAVASATDGEIRSRGMVSTNDGTIVAAGSYSGRNVSNFASAYFTSKGIVDSSYGIHGIVYTGFPENYYPIGYDVALQDDGKIVVAGFSHYVNFPADDYFISLARYKGKQDNQPQYVHIKKWLHRHGFTWDDWPGNNKISYYAVQRSSNGSAFTELARLFNRNSNQQFSYEDVSPLTGDNYYRLAAVSADGSAAYSNIISIPNNTGAVKIYPNPAKHNLQIEGLQPMYKTKLSVTDINGNTRMNLFFTGSSYNLNIAQLKQGNYVLKLENNGSVITKKFMKE
jgi:uncharacterized delta-60 repeat protein